MEPTAVEPVEPADVESAKPIATELPRPSLDESQADPLMRCSCVWPGTHRRSASRCAIETLMADNAEHYAEVVREHALTRVIMTAAAKAAEAHCRHGIAGSELLDAALKAFTAIDVGQPRAHTEEMCPCSQCSIMSGMLYGRSAAAYEDGCTALLPTAVARGPSEAG